MKRIRPYVVEETRHDLDPSPKHSLPVLVPADDDVFPDFAESGSK